MPSRNRLTISISAAKYAELKAAARTRGVGLQRLVALALGDDEALAARAPRAHAAPTRSTKQLCVQARSHGAAVRGGRCLVCWEEKLAEERADYARRRAVRLTAVSVLVDRVISEARREAKPAGRVESAHYQGTLRRASERAHVRLRSMGIEVVDGFYVRVDARAA